MKKDGIETNIDKRWEEGIPHHPASIRLMEEMKQVDADNGYTLDINTGGDGDNGEMLMYIMDVCFERRDQQKPMRTAEEVIHEALTHPDVCMCNDALHRRGFGCM